MSTDLPVLSPELRKGMEDFFTEDQVERVREVCTKILTLKASGELESKICSCVAEMKDLNFGSITYLVHQISEFFFGINHFTDLDFLEKTLGKHKNDLSLLTVALQDIYGLLCLGKCFNIKKEVLLSIIMLNMKFGGGNSGGNSEDNIATLIVEEILGNPECSDKSIISHLRKSSSLDESKYPDSTSLSTRKKGASCPLYAFQKSNSFIKELWEIVEMIYTVIHIKFRNPRTKEELFLTGNKLTDK